MKLTALHKDIDYYLDIVKDWEDPNPAPIIEVVDGIHVVRDDLLRCGSKVRFIDYMIKNNPDVDEWVYGNSPRWGGGQVSLAAVCKRYEKKCSLFLAKAKTMHPNTERAVLMYDAEIHQVVGGVMKICESAAKKYVQETTDHRRRLVPFGLSDDSVHGSIIKVARSLPITPDYVVTVAGSGVLNRGLQAAWPNAICHVRQVGHKLTPEEAGRAVVHPYHLPFKEHCPEEFRPPFPSVLEYDAKAWNLATSLRQIIDPEQTILFWNVMGN